MGTITINGVSIDPEETPITLSLRGSTTDDASTSNYILVQTNGPLTTSNQHLLGNAGATILEHVPENTYICRYNPTDLSPVRALPFVKWADIYLDRFKIGPDLRTANPDRADTVLERGLETSMAQEPRAVTVVLHRDIDPESVRAQLAEAARVNPQDLAITGRKVEILARPQIIERLGRIDAVHHIEQRAANKLFNTVALGIIGVDRTHHAAGLRGSGQIVAVCDTGFDKGSTTNVHPAFAGRVLRIFALGRAAGNDPDGHGTHVAGSVLGDGHSATMGGAVTGSAPEAQLVLQSVLDPWNGLGGLPANLNDLFAQAHAEGARIHTNSWGAAVAGQYTSNSEEVDNYVWNNRDMTILFSAGNEGVDSNANGVIDGGSIGSPGTAKNCITIGASESLRPNISKKWGNPWPQDYPVNPIRDDLWADNPNGLAAFSSRGPTRNQRIKPDLVAPGTAILSTHSRDANVGSFWGASNDSDYCFMGGTSMATPIVAGCAALVREFIGGAPSAALIKAMLINGAVDLSGQYTPGEAGQIPNHAEGFGRVDLPNTVGPLNMGANVEWFDEGPALETGEEWTQVVTLEQDGSLKVTLVWTDPPGEALQNDLDLIVINSSGEERHGNVASHSHEFDRLNNVEQVEWNNLPGGEYTIIVRAFRTVIYSQSFALVVRTTTP